MFKIKNNKKSIWKFIVVGILCLISLFFAFSAGAYLSKTNQSVSNFIQKEISYFTGYKGSVVYSNKIPGEFNFDLYWTVWNTLKENYVGRDGLNDKDIFYGSLKGLVASVGDPYTVFMDPKENKEFEDDLAGTFEGIGAEIGLRDDIITIISPLDGMPAANSGLLAGDQIYAINGTSTLGMTVDEAVRQIRGPKDTTVTLTVIRKGLKETKDYTITRGLIVVKSIKTELRSDGIYIIKINAFNNDTWGLFNQAVLEISDKNVKGIVLDLRNNPGGYLDTAVDMASEWVESGPVVIERFTDSKENKYLSNGRARLKDILTVVLINRGSASASEIVAGALQDYNKAVIVGDKSYGKGSVQSLINLPDNSSIKVTIAKWLTPNGISIDEEGITPDQKVEMKIEDFEQDKDPQMEKALSVLSGGIKDISSKK